MEILSRLKLAESLTQNYSETMIAIADSGSTKTDWVILNEDFSENSRTKTIGFNPYHIKPEAIREELNNNAKLKLFSKDISQVYFYGSGTSADFLKDIIREGFNDFFSEAELHIDHDLLAACYAAYRGEPCIVCILGTGSNACFFDGEKITDSIPSMAYIMGDEGGGVYMGKMLIHDYFSNKLPKELAQKFDEKYHLTIDELNVNVYQKPLANAYLASFSKFVYENREERYMQNLIYNSLDAFFMNQILPSLVTHKPEVNFIGTLAHFYEDYLRTIAAKYHLEVGHIVRRPIDNLVDYHKKYILKK